MNLTTAMLEGLTEQDVFDIAAWQMLNQYERAHSEGGCVYRGPRNTRCPVGWLIPDREYRSAFEGRRVRGLADVALALHCSSAFVRFLETHEVLLMLLQRVHDNHAPFMWWGMLRDIAEKRGLNIEIIHAARARHEQRSEAERIELARRAMGTATFSLRDVAFLAVDVVRIEPFVLPALAACTPVRHMSIAEFIDCDEAQRRTREAIARSMTVPSSLLTGSTSDVITQPETTPETEPA